MTVTVLGPMKFELGRIVATPGALETFPQDFMTASLRRHVGGDWGELDKHDRKMNDDALANDDGRLFSSYPHAKGKLWIITEADRSVTTFLLPSEY